jgi:hypothetical protein
MASNQVVGGSNPSGRVFPQKSADARRFLTLLGSNSNRRQTSTKLIPFALSARLSHEFSRFPSLGDST